MESLRLNLAKKMLDFSIPAFWQGVEGIVPVPLSSERERERGYNPAALLAQEISLAAQIPLRPLLQKVRSTQPQMTLSREERLKNPKGAYQLMKNAPALAKVVLVDDVFTTGATLEECAKVLKKSGTLWVGAIVFGRTPRHMI
jgi:ComF family protein